MSRHQSESDPTPDFSNHGDLRIVQRSGAFPVSDDELWTQGSDVTVKGRSGRTRLHDAAGIILVARNGVVTMH